MQISALSDNKTTTTKTEIIVNKKPSKQTEKEKMLFAHGSGNG